MTLRTLAFFVILSLGFGAFLTLDADQARTSVSTFQDRPGAPGVQRMANGEQRVTLGGGQFFVVPSDWEVRLDVRGVGPQGTILNIAGPNHKLAMMQSRKKDTDEFDARRRIFSDGKRGAFADQLALGAVQRLDRAGVGRADAVLHLHGLQHH